jgi:hypothetical protein
VVAYYGLPTRAWELAAGAALAIAAARGLAPRASIAAWLSWLGLGAIVLSAVTYTTATPFPGWTALVPVLGTAAVLFAGERGDTAGAGRLLRLPPLQLIGRWSYSLYLWHWPVLVLGEQAVGRELAGWERAALMGLSVLLAWGTFRLVEDPIRRNGSLAPARRSIALGGTLVAASVASALLVLVTIPTLTGAGVDAAELGDGPLGIVGMTALVEASTDVELLPADLDPPLARAAGTLPTVYDDGCFGEWDTVEAAACTYGEVAGARTVVLYCDSHAAQWFPALELLANEHGWRLIVLAKPSCPSMDIVASRSRGEAPYPACAAWQEASRRRIVAERPDVLLLSNARTYPALGQDLQPLDLPRAEYLEGAHDRTIAQLQAENPDTRIVLLGVIARPGFDVPTCLSDNLDDIGSCWADPAEAVDRDVLDAQRAVASRRGVAFIDPTAWLCTDSTCPVVIGSQLVYADQAHLSPPFTRTLAPLLDETLQLSGASP